MGLKYFFQLAPRGEAVALWISGGAGFATGEVDPTDTGEADIKFAPSTERNR
jgi:hypothetical protein